ncbi:MAG: N-acetylmuramoyl-L-alanine amidase family protein [Eubacterium sp.]|nr:N-acetylmuramoyl-L-alanine amidase family protein [Eubacterium sp.]
MKKTVSMLLTLLMLLTAVTGVDLAALAEGGADYATYTVSGGICYSAADYSHDNDTVYIEFWSDDPNAAAIEKSVKMVSKQELCGYDYTWTISTYYQIRRLYVDIIYNGETVKEIVYDYPDTSVRFDRVYVVKATEPAKPADPDTGWRKVNNKWYFYNKNVLLKGWWRINDQWYLLDKKDGHRLTGWQKDGGKWYYLNTSGVMATGWAKVSGKWYYFNKSGAMQTGWQYISGKWYYFIGSGAMKTGWMKSGSKWYYFESSGAMKIGWLKSGGKWYFFRNDGSMVASAYVKTSAKSYRFDASGVCLNP